MVSKSIFQGQAFSMSKSVLGISSCHHWGTSHIAPSAIKVYKFRSITVSKFHGKVQFTSHVTGFHCEPRKSCGQWWHSPHLSPAVQARTVDRSSPRASFKPKDRGWIRRTKHMHGLTSSKASQCTVSVCQQLCRKIARSGGLDARALWVTKPSLWLHLFCGQRTRSW